MPEAERHDFRIVAGPRGMSTVIFMDGELLKGVIAYDVQGDVKSQTKITIVFYAGSLNQEQDSDEPTMSDEEARAIAVLNDDELLERVIAESITKRGTANADDFRALLLEEGKKIVPRYRKV